MSAQNRVSILLTLMIKLQYILNMQRFITFFLVTISLFLIPQAVSAQQSQTTGFRAVCLEPHRCNHEDAGCSVQSGHRVRLYSKTNKLTPNSEAYLIECVSYTLDNNPPKFVCTTANSNLDKEAFCGSSASPTCQQYDFYSKLHADINYSIDTEFVKNFKGRSEDDLKPGDEYGVFLFNPNKEKLDPTKIVKTDANGDIPVVEWQSYTTRAHDRRFMALTLIKQIVTPTPIKTPTQAATGATSSATSKGGVGQATIPFSGSGTSTPVISNIPTDGCDNVKYDPAGTVFDAASLEPIPNANVTLNKQVNGAFEDAAQSEFGIVNPYRTLSNGQFSFIVSDGTYKLSPTVGNYVYPINDITKVNQNYTAAYTDLYPASTGEEIVQKGALQHRDIPMQPNTQTGYTYPLQVLSFFQDLNKATGELIIDGRVSHPLARINVYSVVKNINDDTKMDQGTLIKSYQADKSGLFNFKLSQHDLKQGEMFGQLEFVKINLANPTSTDQDPNSKLILPIQPIPNYLEGYAYSSTHQVIPNALVQIKMDYSSIPYYQTYADKTGFFKISSEFLPFNNYSIKYIGLSGNNTVTTSDFIAQNVSTTQKMNTDFYSYKNQKNENLPPPSTPPEMNLSGSPTNDPDKDKHPMEFNSNLVTAVVILMILGVVAAIVGIYILKSKGKNNLPQ